jgi:diguanylate cyclase (GGDEF)-like protein
VRFFAVLLALACWASHAHALDLDKSFHHHVRNNWSIQQGLPQISAGAIAQDRDGYLWVGTQAGLARFDGVRFTSYGPETEPALAGIWIHALHPGRDGRLWIGSYKGVAVHDGERFSRIPAADPERWSSLDVQDFAEDDTGRMWVATTSGLFEARDQRLHPVAGSPSMTHAVLAGGNALWVGGRGAVHRRDHSGWHTLPLPPAAGDAPVNRLAAAQDRLWAATAKGLFVFDAGRWQPFAGTPALHGVPVDLLYVDRAGSVWAGGDEGLARIRNGRLVEFVASDSPGGIRGLRTAFEDREGNLWLGSQWEGLTRLRDSWTRRYSVAEGLADPIVWSLAPDPDGRRIWVGGNEGISVLEDGRLREVVPGSALPHPQGYNLLAEPDRLWIGTRRGVAVLEHTGPYAGEVLRPALLAPMAQAQISGIVRTAPDVLWFATTEGLYRLHDGVLREFGADDGLGDTRVNFFHHDRDGRIHVGTQTGLYELRDGRFGLVGLDRGLPANLDIMAIHRLADGRLVIGTFSERTYFEQGGRWHVLGPDQGMPANSPFFLSEYDGYLWTGGIRGITRVPVADLAGLAGGERVKVRGEMLLNERGDPMSGQQGYCCNGAGNAKGFREGATLWLPSRDGVVAMDTAAIRMNPLPPTVAIERVNAGNGWSAAHAVAGAELPANARDLSFEFTVLSFQDPKSNQVEYRLRGYDQDWSRADPLNRNARYTNLPPGDYVLEVRGRNNVGVPSAEPAQLAFSISPRFHETVWFRLVLVLLAVAVAFAGYRYQLRRHRIQRDALEALVQQRTEALAAANEQLREVSLTDPLTGLRNRRHMASQLPADLAYYDRELESGNHHGEVMMFALVDVDFFKSINDRFGHRAGDLVLQQFAAVLSALVRTGDYVVRWGGEEFLLVFRPMPPDNLPVVGERLRAAVAAHPFDIGTGEPLHLTCSVGLSEYPLFRDDRGTPSWETMVELADQAMYYVKSHGRDGWAAFRPTATTRLSTLLQDLQAGPDPLLEAGRLQLLGTHVPEPA